MALVRFHSKAGGDFFFMPDTQKQVFKVLGRPCTASGAMAVGEYTIDGAQYRFDASGALQQ